MSAAHPILRLENVSKRFGGLSVVEDLSFSVRRGSRTALIGPNGAGKTTVFNLISGAVRLDRGSILLDGVDIGSIPSRYRIRHGVARNFQNIRLMRHLTALENVLVGQHWRNGGLFGVLQPVTLVPGNRWREEARAALADAGLAGCEHATVGSLPYGVQTRIELVRARMAKPRVLLLDEPADGLHAAETDKLREHLAPICLTGGITIQLVDHVIHIVYALCETVIVLNFGRKIAQGSPGQIRENALVREAYLGIETAPAAGERRAS